MTRQPFDEFSKQLFEVLLTPYGRVSVDRTVPGESRRIDIYFEPTASIMGDGTELGRLAQFSFTPCLFEPYRNPPTSVEVRNCVLKLYLLHAELHRAAGRTLTDAELPQLWILASSASDQLLSDFGGELQNGEDGIYQFDRGWRSGIISIAELPTTEDTLWLRLLGKGTTQEQAIAELLMLPETNPKRATALDLLVRWRINIEMTATIDEEEGQFLMALSQAYLEWERQTEQRGRTQGEQRGKAALIVMQLRSRFNDLPMTVETQIEALSAAGLDELAIAVLNFGTVAELEQWLQVHSESN
ncbi:MAG: DUF4351 domain-containing protein [Leptolyngbya sp. Prado105]|jgi:hypothetical protein|nr:DUF4351 domain-containing protein [Leptolyngbya sp. Prado105]